MAEITAALVKELREVSGAGMMDCKKALVENAGDIEQSIDWLRKKGLAAAAKKAGRIAAEGLVGAVAEGTKGAVVEVNCETDFVARNDQFQGFVGAVTKLALGAADIEALKAARLPAGTTVADKLTNLVATIGENMNVRRTAKISVSDGAVVAYVHNAAAPGMGKIGVLVGLESTGDKAKLAALGKQVAMHVAATNPLALSIDAVDPAAVERERGIVAEQAKASGKPAEIIAKMVEGGLRKYYEASVLLEQLWVMDDTKSRVKQVIEKAAKDVGAPVKIAGFARFALGEGIDKEQADAA
jgi:elongation factor Ts